MNLISVTIPVFNEQAELARNVGRLLRFLESQHQGEYEVVIADNGSTDRTLEIAREMEAQHETIRVVHMDQKGRGRALKKVWMETPADILCYMDVDLSTD